MGGRWGLVDQEQKIFELLLGSQRATKIKSPCSQNIEDRKKRDAIKLNVELR